MARQGSILAYWLPEVIKIWLYLNFIDVRKSLMPNPPTTFQDLILRLQQFWVDQGCIVLQAYDMPMGAGTFHPATFLRALGTQPWRCAYVQGCRRPTDGRYGENPNRLQHYYQFQVILKPPPAEIQRLYLQSLEALGLDLREHDIRFVEDDWESPTLGAWGLGWEVWLDGMEICQFTYFQQVGGVECQPITGEITYGLERLATYLQQVPSIYDVVWGGEGEQAVKYQDLFQRNEVEQSKYNFERADTDMLMRHYQEYEQECKQLVEQGLPLPAFEQVILASHVFNLLDARHAVSVTQRQEYILRTRKLAQAVAALQVEGVAKQ